MHLRTPTHTHTHTRSQIVLTTIEPSDHAGEKYDAYEYTVHSHTFETDNIPSARFTYDLSPIQVRFQLGPC